MASSGPHTSPSLHSHCSQQGPSTRALAAITSPSLPPQTTARTALPCDFLVKTFMGPHSLLKKTEHPTVAQPLHKTAPTCLPGRISISGTLPMSPRGPCASVPAAFSIQKRQPSNVRALLILQSPFNSCPMKPLLSPAPTSPAFSIRRCSSAESAQPSVSPAHSVKSSSALH